MKEKYTPLVIAGALTISGMLITALASVDLKYEESYKSTMHSQTLDINSDGAISLVE